MNKLTYIPLIFLGISCQYTGGEKKFNQEKYVTLSGEITNFSDTVLTIKSQRIKYEKIINIKKDGTFSDTLTIPDSAFNYMFTCGEKHGNLYLKNGNKLYFTLDLEKFEESLKFEGINANENNYLVKKNSLYKDFDFMALAMVDDNYFKDSLQLELDKIATLLNNEKDLSEVFIKSELKNLSSTKKFVSQIHEAEVKRLKTVEVLKGNLSPRFANYTTPQDSLVSIEKYIGKYTYIDVWATWCAPCVAETPALKEFLKTEDAKKMNILSISIDQENTSDKWKEMIIKEEMYWDQLKADSAWESSFIKDYAINSIPRFILLDPKGNVINADAPRPSTEEFKKLIKELDL